MNRTSLKFWSAISALISVLLCSCSTPVLIRQDDATFAVAQERLERTAKVVDDLTSVAAERALFLQAESFYQYRYEPPPRGSGFYFAEAAAAVTDFPGFQSLAGSLDLLDLRYRAPDCAVQLWETFLIRYPDSTLRPLTLYRLGWAYRNVGANGLPRESGDSAFSELIKESPESKLAGFARDAIATPWKSKETATTRSLVPGLGQIYLGETRSGIIRLSVAGAALAAVLIPIYQASHANRELSWSSDWPLLATGLAGLVTLSFDYTNSYEDAMHGVVRWNERQEESFNQNHLGAP